MKCIVCKCSDEHACPEGCSWVMSEPPVCSSCVAKYFIAKLWAVIFAMEGDAVPPIARLIRELRTLYSFISSDRAEVLGVPTLREIRQIQRDAEKATTPVKTRAGK